MIYLPQQEIDGFGGENKLSTKEDFDKLRKKLLSSDMEFEAPIKVDGTLSYVEQ